MRRAPHFVAALAALALPAAAGAHTTVAVAPFTTASGTEYQWIGPALADALALRVHEQHELNGVTLRQVNAALRHDGKSPNDLGTTSTAVALGRALGANVLIAGTYAASWPDIEVVVKVYDPKAGELLRTQVITGGLDDLSDLEVRLAKAVAVQLGAVQPNVTPGVAGSDNLRAWRLTTLALDILNWQSLAPRAAHPLAHPSLPKEALEDANAQLEEAVRYDPDFGDAWAALGVSQTLLGNTTEAWRSFGKATALGAGHHPTAVLGAAFVRMRQGRYDEAATILQNAVARHPGFLHARGYLGELYIERRDWAKAREVFDAYAAQVPDHPWVLANRGYVRAKQGDFDGAIADSIAAVDLLPDSAYLMLELASRYVDAGKLLGAEETLKKAIDKSPDESSAYVRLGYVYLLQGKDELAIPITEQALANADFATRARDRGYAHLNLVRAYGHKGNLDRAFEHLTKAWEAGVRQFKELTTDPALEELRADARFEKIVP